MVRKSNPGPTNAELKILAILWELGSGTVAQIQEHFPSSEKAGYTTILKLLQIMHQKGLVVRDEKTRPHVYQPRYKENVTQRRILQDLIRKAFQGSAFSLVTQALSVQKVSKEELTKIKELLASIEKENK